MPPMMGRIIFESDFSRIIMPQNIGAELIYSFVIIVCSLMVYFGTKELYELSSYKGIKYFRIAFLFFAAAYFIRYFIKFALDYFSVNAIPEIPPHISGLAIGQITLFLFMYFSSIAVFYLLYSVMWKKWKSQKICIFHALAIVIATISVIFNDPKVYLVLNTILLVFISAVVLISRSSKKKKSNLYIIYVLLSIFWVLNLLDILIPNFLQTYQLFTYLASTTIFLLILYKVMKRAGGS